MVKGSTVTTLTVNDVPENYYMFFILANTVH